MQELYHYGVKGMKWGIRKEYEAHPRQERRKIRREIKAKKQSELSKSRSKYKVDELYERADKAYASGKIDDAEQLWVKADEAYEASVKEVTDSLKKMYGKDYDDFSKHEDRIQAAKAIGTLTGVVFSIAGTAWLASKTGDTLVKAGEKAIDGIFDAVLEKKRSSPKELDIMINTIRKQLELLK